jgi:hypothetical protein
MLEVVLLETYYSPKRVDYWLRHWLELAALAETPSSARNLLTNGPTPESPRPGARQRGAHGDPCRYVNILADIRRAQGQLRPGSIEAQIVVLIQFGYTLSGISAGNSMGRGRVQELYGDAVKRMAMMLGWEESEHIELPGS